MLDVTTRPPLNGLDLAALDETIEQVRANPACGQVAFRVKTEWKGQTRSESTVEHFTCAGEPVARNFTIVADEPRELLGTDTAPNPQELLLSALNACMMVGYVAQASIRGITLDECRIETEGELDLRGFLGLDDDVPPGYRRMAIWFVLSAKKDETAATARKKKADDELKAAQTADKTPAKPLTAAWSS